MKMFVIHLAHAERFNYIVINKLVVLDWYNRKGIIRTKDAERYKEIKKRYAHALKSYKANIERLRKEYAAARSELTSLEYWKNYLKMN